MPVYENMLIRGRSPRLRRSQQTQAPYSTGQTGDRLSDNPTKTALSGAQAVNQGRKAYWQYVSHAGEGLQSLSHAGANVYLDYSRSKAQELATQHMATLNSLTSGERGLLTRRGEESFNIAGEFDDAANNLRKEAQASLNPLSIRLYDLHMAPFRSNETIRLQRHSGKQFEVFQDRNDTADMENSLEMARQNYQDPEAQKQWLGKAVNTNTTMLTRQGFSQEAIDVANKALLSGAYNTMHEYAWSLKDAEGASKILDEGSGKGAYVVRPHPSLPQGVEITIDRIAKEEGMDPQLIRAIVYHESRGNPNAVSPAGAGGQMQLMPETAKEMGVTNVFDSEQNIRGGIRYLKKLLKAFGGDMHLAIAAYNGGPGRIKKWLANGADPAKLPKETRQYVENILGSRPNKESLLLSKDENAMRKREEMGLRQQKSAASSALRNDMADFENDAMQGRDLSGYREYTESEFTDAFGQDQGKREWLKYTEVRQANGYLRGMGDMTNTEIANWISSNRPEPGKGSRIKDGVYRQVASAMQAELVARAEDPTAYIVTRDRDVGLAREKMLTQLTPQAVQEYVRALDTAARSRQMPLTWLLSKNDTYALADTVVRANNQVEALSDLQQNLGEYSRVIMQQLSASGALPPGLQNTTLINDKALAQKTWDAQRNPTFRKDIALILKAKGINESNLDAAIGEALTSLTDTLQTDIGAARSLFETAQTMARVLILEQNYSAESAARTAANKLAENYELEGSLRIPRGTAPSLVKAGAEWEKTKIVEEEALDENLLLQYGAISTHGSRSVQQEQARDVARQARWHTNRDETGAVLMLHGMPLRDKNGQIIERSWEELSRAGASRKRIAEETYELGNYVHLY